MRPRLLLSHAQFFARLSNSVTLNLRANKPTATPLVVREVRRNADSFQEEHVIERR